MATTMATKKPGKKSRPDPNVLRVTTGPGEKSREALMAEVAYDPAFRSLAGSRGFLKGLVGETGLTESVDALTAQIKDIQAGRMAGAEKTLVAQANTLDAIFNELARRAALNMGEYLNTAETYLRLALKAQSQCRATLETLAAIKNPPVVFARQANIAHGHQQVNNGAPPTRTGETAIQSNELSGASNELLPDTRASALAGRIDTPMEALGEVYRPTD